MFGRTGSNDTNTEIATISKDGHKGISRFKKEREKERSKEKNKEGSDKITDNKSDMASERTAFTGDVLERSFQSMSISDDRKDSSEKDDSSVRPKHFYELAEERAKRNVTELKEPLKLNRYSIFKKLKFYFSRFLGFGMLKLKGEGEGRGELKFFEA